MGADSSPLSSMTTSVTLYSPGWENVLLTEVVFSMGSSRSENVHEWDSSEESPSGSNDELLKMYVSPIRPSYGRSKSATGR